MSLNLREAFLVESAVLLPRETELKTHSRMTLCQSLFCWSVVFLIMEKD